MLSTNPFVARLSRKLVYQLMPAALVTAVGVLLLSNLAKTPDVTPTGTPVEAAINAEAIFKITPREPAEIRADASPEQDKRAKAAASRPAGNPKAVAATTATPQSRRPASEPAPQRQIASVPTPLPTAQIPQQPQATATAAPPADENGVMSKLRSATTAVQRIPQWAAHSVAGWFAAETPPRPPAPVPVPQNFQATTM